MSLDFPDRFSARHSAGPGEVGRVGVVMGIWRGEPPKAFTPPTTATATNPIARTPPAMLRVMRRPARRTSPGGTATRGGTARAFSWSVRRRRSSRSAIGDLTSKNGQAPGHQRLHGAGSAVQDLRHALFGEVLVVAKDDGGSLPGRQPSHGLPQLVPVARIGDGLLHRHRALLAAEVGALQALASEVRV